MHFTNNKKLRHIYRRGTAAAVTLAMLLPMAGCFGPAPAPPDPDVPPIQTPAPDDNGEEIAMKTRNQLLHFSDIAHVSEDPAPKVPAYQAEPGLSNVENLAQFHLGQSEMDLLEKNLFAIRPRWSHEFYEGYESNRYSTIPNFVTVDSLLHTYHLYFSMLLNRTEKEYLADELLEMSRQLLKTAQNQYNSLKGTEWEEPARRNVAFFAVGTKLQDPAVSVPEFAADIVSAELAAIGQAEGIAMSPMTNDYVDYSQFKPRGYYAGDLVLEAYFRTMMWYGQINFAQKDETLNRAAALMTIAIEECCLPEWEKIYTVTACFAGVSDDLTYYEYSSALHAAFGPNITAQDLTENTAAWETFNRYQKKMHAPAVNSIPVWDGTENIEEETEGFRFMGQRFTVDAAIMQRLIYSKVKENPAGEKRMLPDTLDVPAALGSKLAENLLEEKGNKEYAGYSDNLADLQQLFRKASPDTWGTSLYSGWLYTIQPLLKEKKPGSPSFMLSEEWQKKRLESFCGSYTELKHDTVLYGKQVMAEMGGDSEEVADDRGYVEPELDVYRRFVMLTHQTREGLDAYDILTEQDKHLLTNLEDLAMRLLEISQKELQNKPLSEEDYELIRTYGGTLEHFWIEAAKTRMGSEYPTTQEMPASLVTDIATDPNGTVLQIANAQPAEVLVIVPVDGKLRIASGFVYNFYQFDSPMSSRMTDQEWRYRNGDWYEMDAAGNVAVKEYEMPDKPWWTKSYWREKE